MVPSVRSALTTCIALMVVGGEARKTRGIGPTPAAPDRHRAAMFSFAAMAVFLVLSACAEAPATEPRASSPAQRNVTAPAPTPCTIPNTGQTGMPNVLNSPQPSDTDRLKVECLQGVPPLRTTWSWSGPRWEEPPDVAAARARAESEREARRQAEKDFQRRKRAGR
jgi:hypothetical protein